MARPDLSNSSSDNGLQYPTAAASFNALDWTATLLLIIGGLNWGLIGAFGLDLVASVFGNGSPPSRGIYMAVGLAALYGLYLMTKMGRAGNPR